jgi:hypothetical protein
VTKRVSQYRHNLANWNKQPTVRRCGWEGSYRLIASATKCGYCNMWDVYLIDNDATEQLNQRPYDIEQIAELLSQLEELEAPVGSVVLRRSVHIKHELFSVLADERQHSAFKSLGVHIRADLDDH